MVEKNLINCSSQFIVKINGYHFRKYFFMLENYVSIQILKILINT